VVGVPDGANTDNTDNTEQEPGTPQEQVEQEIASTEVMNWWRSLFGLGGPAQPHESGGGGTGGQFMFANLDELDRVIARWEEERDGILADREAIREAYDTIAPPAGDMMSNVQVGASQASLANMYQHNNAMLRYAENYIAKLRSSREQMAVMDEGARDNLRSVREA
jgi:hypothetical protein